MIKILLPFLWLAILLFSGCFSSSSSYRRYAYLKDSRTAIGDTLITLERTGCLGYCPAYRVWIASGKVMFEGREYVNQIGLAEGFIHPDSVTKLIGSFLSSNYFSLPDTITKCKKYWTDSPTTITSIRLGKMFKQVFHYEGCNGFSGEAELYKLKNEIDRIAKTKRWTGKP